MSLSRSNGWFLLLLLLPACSQDNDQVLVTADVPESVQLITHNYYKSAEQAVVKLKDASETLADSVAAFLTRPDQTNLDSCRHAWLLLHKTFVELDFYFSRILESDPFRTLVFNIHAWPLAPGFIDSLPEYPTSGIVNDLTLELSRASLTLQQAVTSPEEISLGMHALEYFLWQRSLADFQPVLALTEQQVSDGMVLEQLGNNRRRVALKLISNILYDDIFTLQSSLTAEQRFDSKHVVNDPLQALRRALKRSHEELIRLGSLDQQNHSPFSQTSLQDILYKIYFIHQSFSNETNLDVVLQARDHKIASEIQRTLDQILKACQNLRPNDSEGIASLTSLIAALDRHVEQIVLH
jgi:hypothetical protein